MGRKLTAIIGTLTLAVLCQLLPSWAAAQTKVSLGSVDNLYGIATQGVAITGGGIDNGSGGGSAYAGSLLGTSLSYNGVSFTIPAPGPNTAVQSKTISLPAGKFNTLSFLGAAVNGNQQNQAFIVKYTDGTSKTFTQSLSDWGGTPGGFAGESTVITTAFKILANGTTHNGSYKLYGYSFTLDSTRTVASFAMPANRNVVMLALDLIANKATAASPTFSPLPGTFTSAPTLTLASATPGASIFFTTNGTTPTTSSTKYTAPFKVAATETIKAIATASGFTTSAVVSGVYTINASATPTATPTFSPKAGTYATPQSVSLSDATSGASIFFTTDGTTPTAASSKYTGAFEVSKTTTVKALGVASGHTNSAVASATYTISLSAPSGLSYPVPPTLLIGNAVSLTPSVTGSVTSYTVSPALPHGLALNATSGLITGKPTSVTAAATYTVKAANAAGSTTFALPLKVDSGPTVHLTATASTATGATLTYTWKTTDGKLLNTNGSQTDWELPAGFGLHFGYVMVSDGRSGYAVGRVVVNTDSFGAAQVIPIGLVETPVRPVAAALAPVRAGRAAAAPEAVPDERKPSVLFAAAPGAAAPADLPAFPVFLEAPDIAPFLQGNTGIPGFTTRDSGRPGPHTVLVSLIHGNEIAGAIVLAEMLAQNFTPLVGKLTLGFANTAAYAKFDPENPVASRFVEEDLNRVWDDIQLFGVRRSLELDRAREIRPLIDVADIVLDLHSMLWPSEPLLLCGPAQAGRDLALAIASPPMVIADQGHAGGKRLIDYGRFTETASTAACILVEAGQHWEPGTIIQMRATIAALLHSTGQFPAMPPPAPPNPVLAEVSHVITAKTNRFVFERNFRGGDLIPHTNTLIAHDGDTEIRTPYDDCLLIMPSHKPSHGHTAIRLAKINT